MLTRHSIPAGVLELAELERAQWESRLQAIRASGVPTNDRTPEEQRILDAVERLERANSAIEALTAESTDEQRTAAQAEFDAAERAHTDAVEARRRTEAVRAARDAAPAPAGDTRGGGGGGGGGGDTRVVREPETYERGNGNSYFLDLARSLTGAGISGSAERLRRHAQDIDSEVERREARARSGYTEEVEGMLRELPTPLRRGLEDSGLLDRRETSRVVERRDLTRTDGQGGHFVPPVWLLDEYAELARAGRPFVNATRQIDLPGGTDSINIPRIATGTSTAPQTADNAAVSETDLTDAVVTAPVRTIAGQQDLPMQLLDQSPIGFDEIVFADLMADYNFRCEDQAFNGTNANGQIKGILGVSFNAITYTDASPTVPEIYPKIADALRQARENRKRPITHGWIAPRRYYWAEAALDSANRPLVVPQIQGPNNALGTPGSGGNGGGSGEDVPLWMLAMMQMTDAIPVNLGAGTNEDRVVVTRMQDHVWFEGVIRARAMTEVLSGTLQVRLQVYNYVAATFERYPTATSVIAGTGLVTPTF